MFAPAPSHLMLCRLRSFSRYSPLDWRRARPAARKRAHEYSLLPLLDFSSDDRLTTPTATSRPPTLTYTHSRQNGSRSNKDRQEVRQGHH
jgi:hypothetical protein